MALHTSLVAWGAGVMNQRATELPRTSAQSPSRESQNPVYGADVLREQDTAVADHLASLEKLADGLKDPAAAKQLRMQADKLRRVAPRPPAL